MTPTAVSDPDSTGTVLQMLSSGNASDRALDWLKGEQDPSGGFGYRSGVNAQSTGLVLQGLSALGLKPGFLSRSGKSGLDYLRARQKASGAVEYSATSDQTPVWVTGDTLVALSGKSLPVAAPPRKPVTPVPDSGGGGSGGSSGGSGGGSGGSSSGGSASNPAPSVPGVDQDGGGGSSSGSGGATPSDPVPLDPATPEEAVPDEGPDSIFETTPIPPTEALLAASESGPKPSPVVATLIGLLTAAGIGGLTVFLVRRKGW